MASNIPVIVQGNSFSLAIPLQIYYINGDQMDLEDYTPDPTDEISIQLKGERRQYTYTPTVDGNICNIDLSGNELAGNYSVVVSIVKASGQRLRSFRTDQFFIVESSDDLTPADIIEGLEENVIYLNSSIFVAGEDGRGIESIVKTGTSGLVDTYTITYSDNTTSTYNVTNGAQGETGATIASVEKTATVGKVDTYTITMTDGNTFDFEVTNGLDGVDLGLANIVNDLVTGGATNVLSAEQGVVLKGLFDHSYTDINSGSSTSVETLHFDIIIGQMRTPVNLPNTHSNSARATVSRIYTQDELQGAQYMVIPDGYNCAIIQTDKLTSHSTGYLDTTWQSGTFSLINVLDANYPYKLINFKKSNNGTMASSDKTTLESDFYIAKETIVPAVSAIDIINANGSTIKSIYNADDTDNIQLYSKEAIDALITPPILTGQPYQGNRINFKQYKYTYEQAVSMTAGGIRQGGAVYDKYFFQFHTNNNVIQIYDLSNGTLVQTLTLTSNTNNHAGSGGFSNYKVNSGDPFPLLYQSSMDEYKVYVYRITGTTGNWSIALYQTITMPSGTDLMYLPNITIDAENNKLVVFGYKANSWRTGDESLLASYEIPNPTQGDLALSASNALGLFSLPFIYAEQGAFALGGRLYLTYGNTLTFGGLIVINYFAGVIESHVDFSYISNNLEPEACGIYNNAMYFSTQDGKIYKINF